MNVQTMVLLVVAALVQAMPLALVVAAEPADSDIGMVTNEGNVPVTVVFDRGNGRFFALELPPNGVCVAPRETVGVAAAPVLSRLGATGDKVRLLVDRRGRVERITAYGGRVKYDTPTAALANREQVLRGVTVPDLALPPAAAEAKEKVDWSETLRQTNDMYMRLQARLPVAGPEEARRIQDLLPHLHGQIDDQVRNVRAEHGFAWKELYRDRQTGKLPGGLIEDAASRLAKAREARARQDEAVRRAEADLAKAKQSAPEVEARWEDRVRADQQALERKFKQDHGPSAQWTPEEQAAYAKAYADLARTSREQWEKDRAAAAEAGHALGKAIRALADAQAERNLMDKDVADLEQQVAVETEREEKVQKYLRILGDDKKADSSRAFAALTLGSLREPRAVEPMINAFGQMQDRTFRQMVLRALGDIGDPSATQFLTGLLKDEKFSGAAEEALKKIAAGGKPDTAPPAAPR